MKKEDIRILVGCEESQAVTIAFRDLGFIAYSCDLLQCSGGHPEWHFNTSIYDVFNCGDLVLETGSSVFIDKWDIGIFFPPCTHLAVSGSAWFAEKIKDGRQQQGIDFFMNFANLTNCERVAIENPVSIMSRIWRKPDQIINPYEFGHMEQKKTCLWLKGLPLLQETNNVYDEMMKIPKKERERIHYLPPGPDRAKNRSKTFPGIAKAMAQQWAGVVSD